MRRRLLLTICLAGAFAFPLRAARALDESAAGAFVETLMKDALTSFAGQHPEPERRRIIERLIDRYVDMRQVSRDVLGRFWDTASAGDQARFQKTLLDYLLTTWFGDLDDLAPQQKVMVRTTRPVGGDRVLVHSIASELGEESTPVDWVIAGEADGRLAIVDVSVDNVSPLKTLRSEFTSFLYSNSGRIDALIAALQKKIDAKVAERK